MTLKAWFRGPMFRLNIVIISSLAFLAYGFNPPSGVVEILQLPVAALQVYFILVVVMQRGAHGFLAPLTNIQRGLIGTIVIYMIFVSATSPVPSAQILVFSWIIHIFFFVALLSFFSDLDLERIDTIWWVLGLTALIHVGAFLIAWLVWPEEIKPKTLLAFGHIRHLSYLLVPAATVTALQFITQERRALFPILCFSAATLYMFFTGSRGGAIALSGGLAAAGFYLVWYGQEIRPFRVVILLGVTGALIAVTEFLPPLPFPWITILERGENALNQTGIEMLTGRDQVWEFIATAIAKNWMWGYGPAMMSQLPGWQGSAFYHPHNIALQLLLHWGVVGTSLLLATFASFAPTIWQALRSQPGWSVLPIAVLCAMAIHAVIDGNLFYPFSIVVAMAALASLDAIGRRVTGSSVDERESTPSKG